VVVIIVAVVVVGYVAKVGPFHKKTTPGAAALCSSLHQIALYESQHKSSDSESQVVNTMGEISKTLLATTPVPSDIALVVSAQITNSRDLAHVLQSTSASSANQTTLQSEAATDENRVNQGTQSLNTWHSANCG
jgi:hypothetical protein